jgi:hypothetical protein
MTLYRQIRLRDGTLRALRPGELVPDGAVVFSAITVKDHMPDPDRNDGDETDRAYESMKRDISQAWRKPRPEAKEPTPPPATSEEARARMIEHLSNAWKGAAQ